MNRENLLKARDYIASLDVAVFNTSAYFYQGGTPCCPGGHLYIRFNDSSSRPRNLVIVFLRDFTGLDAPSLEHLFGAHGPVPKKEWLAHLDAILSSQEPTPC